MTARLMRLILGILVLIGQFLDPSTRWLSWSVVGLLLFEGITNIRIMEKLLSMLGVENTPVIVNNPDNTSS